MRRQAQEVDVAERLGQDHAVERRLEAELAQPAPASADAPETPPASRAATTRTAREDVAERLAVVDVRRPVQRQHRVSACLRRPPDRESRSSVASGRCRRSVSIITLPTR